MSGRRRQPDSIGCASMSREKFVSSAGIALSHNLLSLCVANHSFAVKKPRISLEAETKRKSSPDVLTSVLLTECEESTPFRHGLKRQSRLWVSSSEPALVEYFGHTGWKGSTTAKSVTALWRSVERIHCRRRRKNRVVWPPGTVTTKLSPALDGVCGTAIQLGEKRESVYSGRY